jgi:hypothetical protein
MFAVACGLLAASVCEAARASGPVSTPPVVNADWQGPLSLPRAFAIIA